MPKLSWAKEVKKYDQVFSQWIRLSEADDSGMVECFTCGTVKPWNQGMQAGHFVSRSHFSVRWLPFNVRPQCVACNMFHQGRQYEFGQKLNRVYGDDMSEQLLRQSKQPHQYNAEQLKQMRLELQKEVDELREAKHRG
jgi:hypothetical protein